MSSVINVDTAKASSQCKMSTLYEDIIEAYRGKSRAESK